MKTLPELLDLRCPACAGRAWDSTGPPHVCRTCGARCALLADQLIMELVPAERSLAGSEDAKVAPSNSFQGEAGGESNRAVCDFLHRRPCTPACREPL